jgi:hypothetical protein
MKPFRDIWGFLTKFNHPKAWIYFSAFGYAITRFFNRDAMLKIGLFSLPWDILFIFMLGISFLWFEYEKGEWKYEYRKRLKEEGMKARNNEKRV